MPFEYTKDDEKRRIRILVRDPISEAEAIAVIDRQAADRAWDYGVLYDARSYLNRMLSDLPKIAAHVRDLASQHGPRGPVAIVTRDATMVGVGQIYAGLGEKAGFEVQVFWDVDEAERWLESRKRA